MAFEATLLSQGDTIKYRPSSTVNAGAVVVLGELVAVAHSEIKANELGTLHVLGLVRVNKAAADDISVGDVLYWDNTNKVATKTSTGNKRMGLAATAASSGNGVVDVLLGR